MTSIFQQAMGADFERLHPMLQRRFGVGLDSGYACVGRGTMCRIRRGPWWTVPFLQLGRLRNILVPDTGTQVPFRIDNYPYRDPLGREAVTFNREYELDGLTRRFDATMIAASRDGHIVDYLGTHQHLAVDLELRAEADGSLHLRSHAQRFYEGPVGFRFPLLFSGRADLRESYDDTAGLFRIDLVVTNPVFGFLFGYDGQFTCQFPRADDAPPTLSPSATSAGASHTTLTTRSSTTTRFGYRNQRKACSKAQAPCKDELTRATQHRHDRACRAHWSSIR